MAGIRYRRGGMYAADMTVYARLLSEQNTNTAELTALKDRVAMALRQELTSRQRLCIRLYYVEKMKMSEIGNHLGIDKSTVSRNIKQGEKRLRRCLRFGAAGLLEQAGVEVPYGTVSKYAKREGFENVDHY